MAELISTGIGGRGYCFDYALDQELHLTVFLTWMRRRNEGIGLSLVRDMHVWGQDWALHHCFAVFLTGSVRQGFSHTMAIQSVTELFHYEL